MRFAMLLFASFVLAHLAVAAPGMPADAGEYRFGEVMQGRLVTHAFTLENDGAKPLRIANVQLSPPLRLDRMPASLPAGGTARLQLTLDTKQVEGDYAGKLIVAFDDPAMPVRSFLVTGRVVPEIEVRPRPAIFLSTTQGQSKSATLEIINHGSGPLDLGLPPPPAGSDYRLDLRRVEAGQRYRLTATLPGSAPAGRRSGYVELPRAGGTPLRLGLNLRVHERVHAFPEIVDFGLLHQADLGDGRLASQTLMVYQTGGHDFELSATTDMRGVVLRVERGLQGDRASIVATLLPGRTQAGKLTGSIALSTNDPEYPRLVIPVAGEIAAD